MAINPSAAASGYQPGGGGATGLSTAPGDTKGLVDYWSLSKCKKSYLDYLASKRLEIDEQQEARRYRHGAHWTAAQVEALNKRKQPVVTYNRIGRKIDGIVGLVEKLRQDPKAYPRTPKHEEGADLATAVIRYALESQDWAAKSPLCAESGAVDGIGGIELELTEGDHQDKEVGLEIVDADGFFYDPRSFRMDFSDATYMGMGKWLDPEVAKELIPGKDAEIDASVSDGSNLTTNSDRDDKWFFTEGDRKRIRLVDIWYRHKGEWCWCLFTGSTKLMEGKSYFVDEKRKTICKFIMYSACVDHDGDRYGFVRNLKSVNDEINQRRSKALHELNTRRIVAQEGHFTDVEEARRQAARPDGIVIYNPIGNDKPEFDDASKNAAIQGQLAFLEDAKREIENFAGYAANIETGANVKSGRAIALLQQQALADLGPYILAYRGWKLRVYRAVFNAIRSNWTAERWIRVTDDDGLAQFVQINGMQVDPQTGLPTMVNAIGSLDVDIILDEGPDTVNSQQDLYETLSQITPALAPLLHPQKAEALVDLTVEMSPLAGSAKKRFRDAGAEAKNAPPPPDPAIEAARAKAQIDLESRAKQQQMDAENAAQDMEIARVKAAADMQNKQREADVELEAFVRKSNTELEAMHAKNQMTLDLEGQRGEMQCKLEERKSTIQVGAKQEENKIRAQALRQSKDPQAAIEADYLETVKNISSDFEKGIKDIASGFEKGMTSLGKELAQAIAAPKEVKVQRDKSGRITGAELN